MHIATLEVHHDYYESGLFKSLEIRPTASSRELFRTLKIVVKMSPGTIHIFTSNPEVLKTATTALLRFEFECTDPYYINFTALPTDYSPDNVFSYANVAMVDTAGGSPYKLQQQILTGAPETSPRVSNPLGIIDLSPAALYDQFMANSSAVTYTIHFEARKTYWKYVVVNTHVETHNNLTIIDSERNEIFNSGSDEFVPHNDVKIRASVFISKIPYALSSAPKLSFQLVNNFNLVLDKARVVLGSLPTPSPNQLYPAEDATGTILYSHMYIYL